MRTSDSAASCSRATAANGRRLRPQPPTGAINQPDANSSQRLFKLPLCERGAKLKARLVTGTEHADDDRIPARKMRNRNRTRRRGANGSQVVAANQRNGSAGIRIEQQHARLMIG